VGNKLLVSLDLLFAIRNQIKLGEDPRVSVGVVLKSVQEQTGKGLALFSSSVLSTLTSREFRVVQSSFRVL
jgi:hypothetical protein